MNNIISQDKAYYQAIQAIISNNYSEVAREENTTPYAVKKDVEKVISTLDNYYEYDKKIPTEPVKSIEITDVFINKLVISSMVIGKASVLDAQLLIKSVFDIDISVGKISRILNEASVKAKEFNNSVDLSSIEIGLHDEIFQGKIPILTGIDPKSTYVYLISPEESRDSTTWGINLLELEETANFAPNTSVNDAGSGMTKGLKEAFPSIEIQSDIFHAEKIMTETKTRIFNKILSSIKNEYALEKIALKDNATLENIETYFKKVEENNVKMDKYDTLELIIYCIKEDIFKIGGYTYKKRAELLDIYIKEMENLEVNQCTKIITYLKKQKNTLIQFVKKFEETVEKLSQEKNIDKFSLLTMWEQKGLDLFSERYSEIEYKLICILKENYQETKDIFRKIVSGIVRASSMVENINGRIRNYINLKRVLNNNYLELLKLYFNTKKYRRTRVNARKNKSPLELLTGHRHKNFLDIVC